MSGTTARRRVLKVPVDGDAEHRADLLAAEEPLEIRVDGEPLTVTMRTPGDDIDLAPAPPFVLNDSGAWVFNTGASGSTVSHAVWTDNRDVRAPKLSGITVEGSDGSALMQHRFRARTRRLRAESALRSIQCKLYPDQ